MSDTGRDHERIESRADLLPEERTAGSEDPEGQAEAILAESDERTAAHDPTDPGDDGPDLPTPA